MKNAEKYKISQFKFSENEKNLGYSFILCKESANALKEEDENTIKLGGDNVEKRGERIFELSFAKHYIVLFSNCRNFRVK